MVAALANVLDFQDQSVASLECKLKDTLKMKMERNSLKEYSILAMVPKEEQQTLKTCFRELHFEIRCKPTVELMNITSTMFISR